MTTDYIQEQCLLLSRQLLELTDDRLWELKITENFQSLPYDALRHSTIKACVIAELDRRDLLDF